MNQICDAARYVGPPSQDMIKVIQGLTGTDGMGRRFFRHSLGGQMMRLRDESDYLKLNIAIDFYRKQVMP